ncbi:MAG: extracellular solute-binding protein [Lachnospiraceae bacterium]|nr:extracellular solute-binding protein [Lachnospiraceae bacterium]
MKERMRRAAALLLTGTILLGITACGQKGPKDMNLVSDQEEEKKTVYLFGPMEKSKPDMKNLARSAADLTIIKAEEELNLTVEYRTYTAENYQEKTYDDVTLDRARNNMDDLYLLNPDTVKVLGEEGKLADLSGLDNVDNLREVVKAANTIDGKLVAVPQEVVVYGLFINKDMFDRYDLELPEKPEDLMECCRVLKENGIETPIGANRWWLETIVLAQAYAELYNGGNTEAQIEALNNKEAKYSDYMRPGFEYLKEMIDKGYIDAEKAYTYEAIEGEGPDFLAQKTPIVMAYWGAANSETAYGNPDFHMQVIGFPSEYGPMPVVPMTGYSIGEDAVHREEAMEVLNIMTSDESLQMYSEVNKVISPSVNVNVDCIDALKPLRDRFNENIFVLGSNAGMELEQWGNTCRIVRELLNGASVDACMAEFDRLQEEL